MVLISDYVYFIVVCAIRHLCEKFNYTYYIFFVNDINFIIACKFNAAK